MYRRTFWGILLGTLIANLEPLTEAAPPPSGVELHAHLFMKLGMTWAFRGQFTEDLHAQSYRSRLSSQANAASLEASENAITVVSLFAHPLFTLSIKDSIRAQIDQAEEFVLTHPGWMIARSPWEARQALARGQRILILSLEGASGVLDSPEDLNEFIDRRGIRMVTFLHLTDDYLGGVALLRGLSMLSSPLALWRQIFHRHFNDGIRTNDRGLTPAGHRLAAELIRRKVWIDLAHASDLSQAEILPLLKQAGQPALYTHTVLRKYHQAERGISEAQLQNVRDTRGIIGLMPSPQMLEGTSVGNSPCPQGIPALAVQYQEVAAIIGAESVMLGSDTNGGIPHLAPGCAPGTSLNEKGLWNIGQSGDVWRALKINGANVPNDPHSRIERFLDAWSAVVRYGQMTLPTNKR